jgi:glycosyltransferase involved in cell wall biosynthesis
MTPRTSVLMPAYRNEETLRASVESALAQTVGDLELIVVDDASPVPCADVLADVRDPRLRIIRHARNRNTAGARNTALRAARAPLVSQLDADDTWEPRYLATVLPCFADPSVGLAYTNCFIEGHPDGLDDYIGDPTPHPLDSFPKLAEACPVPSLTATMRRDAVLAAGGYAEWVWGASDYHLYAKLVARGWRFAYVHERLARYRWPIAGKSKSADTRRAERGVLMMWLGFVARHPRIPGPRRQVRVRLRRELSLLGDELRRRARPQRAPLRPR